MPSQLEIAQSLGFDSVAAMNEHQAWLAEMQELGQRSRQAVQESEKTGVVNLRTVFLK